MGHLVGWRAQAGEPTLQAGARLTASKLCKTGVVSFGASTDLTRLSNLPFSSEDEINHAIHFK